MSTWLIAGIIGALVLLASIVGVGYEVQHQYNLGYETRGRDDQRQLDQLKEDYSDKLKAASDAAALAAENYLGAKKALDDWTVDHPPRVVRMCVSTAGARPGDVHTPPDQPGTHTGTSRADGVGGVSGPDPGGGTGAVSPDIGPLLSDYGAASQDWVNALRECVGR